MLEGLVEEPDDFFFEFFVLGYCVVARVVVLVGVEKVVVWVLGRGVVAVADDVGFLAFLRVGNGVAIVF